MVSKQEKIGEQILYRIHRHDYEKGGIFTLTTGAMGQAKTSVNLGFCDYTINHHPTEKVFFSECYDSPIQVFKLQNRDKIVFHCKDDEDFKFRNRMNDFKPFKGVPIKRFVGFHDLWEQAEPGMVNVVFFGNRMYWMDFIHYATKISTSFSHFFIDEIAEMCPAYQSGMLNDKIGDFGFRILKNIRKNWINIHANTQTTSLVDWRVRAQVMVSIFLPGARTGRRNRVWQKAIDNLIRDSIKGNEAYLEMSGEFGVTQFTNIYKPTKNFLIDCICNDGEGGEYIINSLYDKKKVEVINQVD